MIVPMRKVYVVARNSEREQLLNTVRELGMIHLVPVDPARAVPDDATKRQMEMLQQALQNLSGVEPRETAPEDFCGGGSSRGARNSRKIGRGSESPGWLHHQLEQIAVWGDLRLKDLEDLRQAGIDLRFYAIPADAFHQVEAECVAEVGHLTNRQIIVAVADRRGQTTLPAEATLMRLPSRDAAAIRSEAKTLDQSLHQDLERLHELAGMTSTMETQLWHLEQQAEQTVAELCAATDDTLCVSKVGCRRKTSRRWIGDLPQTVFLSCSKSGNPPTTNSLPPSFGHLPGLGRSRASLRSWERCPVTASSMFPHPS